MKSPRHGMSHHVVIPPPPRLLHSHRVAHGTCSGGQPPLRHSYPPPPLSGFAPLDGPPRLRLPHLPAMRCPLRGGPLQSHPPLPPSTREPVLSLLRGSGAGGPPPRSTLHLEALTAVVLHSSSGSSTLAGELASVVASRRRPPLRRVGWPHALVHLHPHHQQCLQRARLPVRFSCSVPPSALSTLRPLQLS